MVGGHGVDHPVLEPLPEGVAVRLGSQGRGHDGLQALLGVCVGGLGEGEVLGAGLHAHALLPLGTGLAHIGQAGGAGQVHHVHWRLPGMAARWSRRLTASASQRAGRLLAW